MTVTVKDWEQEKTMQAINNLKCYKLEVFIA